ncbi:MFS transporter [Subtercola lobariae]|uniref:MFS transporter n=1 Tax=Subtercola lobariae TaxID=1588641 RepID=A0A917B566_9MICO|nr:MFS transporter [Subtercola lobariae]GGF22613.1 MFS transporter [Subtercola lobariae]
MSSTAPGLSEARSFDSLLEGRSIGRFQVLIISVCAVISMVDGFDTQVIALAANGIAQQFGANVADFGPIFGIGLFGGLVGAIVFGLLGDRFGRKPVLLISVAIVAIGSLVTPFTETTTTLLIVRFVTGLGLGGALPGVISLTSEYAPVRRRAATVALMFCGFPLGAVVGGLLSTVLIPAFGWASVFWLGGLVPVILIPVIVFAIPESVRFLSMRSDKRALARVLKRLRLPEEYAPSIQPAPAEERAPLPSLFTQGRAVGTLMLWLILLLSLLMTYFLTNWIPLVATQNGLDARTGILGAVMLNLGSIVGSIVLGRFVRARPTATIVAGYLLGAVAIAAIGQVAHSAPGLLITTFLAGFFAIGAQLCTVGLCATFYSDALRATGVGSAMGVARLGAILGPVIGGVLLAGGVSTPIVFVVIAIVSVVAALAMLVMGLLVLRRRSVQTAPRAAVAHA